MAITLFKEVNYSLSKLIQDIDMGEIGLPDIQRPFVWKKAKVRDLFDSMYKGFPVGYLLFWSNGAADGFRQIGTDDKQQIPRLLIVDGQQRLTSLYAVLKAQPILKQNYQSERILIAFCPQDQTFKVADAAVRRDPEYIPDISQLWSGELSRRRFVNEFFDRLRQTREVTENEEDDLHEAIDQLYDLQNYPFTAMELSSTVDEEAVAEVFVRINSQGKTLNQADFILTLMSVFWEDGRKTLERYCRESRIPATDRPSPFNPYIMPEPDELLRVAVGLGFERARLKFVYSILRGKDMETETVSTEFRDQAFSILQRAQEQTLQLQNWHEFFKALRTAGFMSDAMITSQNTLLFSYVFFLLGKTKFAVDHYALRLAEVRGQVTRPSFKDERLDGRATMRSGWWRG